MPGAAPLSLDSVSVLLVWTAIAIYALAFIAYAVDLAKRSQQVVDTKDARERELVGAGAAASGGMTAISRVREEERVADAALHAPPAESSSGREWAPR
jgi:hypothetical protein